MAKFAVIGLLISLFSANSIAQQSLVFTTFENTDPNSAIPQKLIKAYKALGIDISFKYLPGKRAITMANKGKVDGELYRIAGLSEQYPNLVMVEEPVDMLEWVAYTTRPEIKINGWESLHPYHIGINSGVIFTERKTRGMKRTMMDRHSHLFGMLVKQRLDVVITTRPASTASLKALNLTDQVIANEPAIASIPLYHYLHIKHSDKAPQVAQQLKKLKQSVGE